MRTLTTALLLATTAIAFARTEAKVDPCAQQALGRCAGRADVFTAKALAMLLFPQARTHNPAECDRLSIGTIAHVPFTMMNAHVLLPALLIAIAGASPLRAQFGPERIIEDPETIQPNAAALADLDGDGDNDLVSSSMEGKVAWYANDGNGNFGTQHVIISTAAQARGLDVADLDGDGDPDVLSCSSWNDELFWFENDGAATFVQHMISTTANGTWCVRAVDMDGDGDRDVLHVSPNDSGIRWYANDGSGNFGTVQLIADLSAMYAAGTSDLDGDGDLDVFFASAYTDDLTWWPNDGSGNFGTPQSIATGVDGANHCCAADLDGDGDNDVISAAWNDNEVAWYENLGAGTFGPQQSITTNAEYAHFVTTLDVDSDGDIDVLSASASDDKIAWYRNDGAGNFGSQLVITNAAYWNTFIALGDADGDGDVDVVSTSWEDDKVAWYRNDGLGNFGPQLVVTASASTPVALCSADVDGDGDKDLLAGANGTNDSRILLYENLGGSFGAQQEITDQVIVPVDVQTADLDGDGDPDMLTASNNGNLFAWAANDGTGAFGPQQTIDTPFYPNSVAAADIDGDGDLDLIGGASSYARVYVNDGSGGFTVLPLASTHHRDVSAADLDGDGDPDMLAITLLGGTTEALVWAPNDGSGTFGTEQVISQVISLVNSAHAADLDADGDLDVLASTAGENKIVWYANDGTGAFGPEQVISLLTTDPRDAFVADVDQDGDPDVLSISYADDKLAWYQNDGSGTFGPQIVINLLVDGASVAVTSDVDGDGDPDVILAGALDRTIAWHENHVDSQYRIEGTVFLDTDANGALNSGDAPFPVAPVSVTPLLTTVMTGVTGVYTAFVDTGAYALESTLPDPLWTLTTAPAQQQAVITPLAPVASGLDFGWAPLVDTSIVVPAFTLGGTFCGGNATSWLSYVNRGTRIEQGTITLALDPLLTFIASDPAPTSISGNTFGWSFDSLGYFQTALITLDIQLPGVVSMGAVMENTVTVTTVNDAGDTTGVFDLQQSALVSCAYDPNDKQVEPPGVGSFGAIPIDTEWLTYTIRFQNTGTDTAYNVMVVDQLDDSVDRTSLQVVGSSHALTQVQIEADGEAVFKFDGILLPDSNVNEPASCGFVKFRIRPLAGAPDGTVIANTAYIHFDLNLPVVTNTVLNKLVDCAAYSALITELIPGLLSANSGYAYQWYLAGVPIDGASTQELLVTGPGAYSVQVTSEFGCVALSEPFVIAAIGDPGLSSSVFTVFPNPTSGAVRLISAQPLGTCDRIDLVDVTGKVLRTLRGTGTRELVLEGNDLAPGLYVLRVLREGRPLGSAKVMVQ